MRMAMPQRVDSGTGVNEQVVYFWEPCPLGGLAAELPKLHATDIAGILGKQAFQIQMTHIIVALIGKLMAQSDLVVRSGGTLKTGAILCEHSKVGENLRDVWQPLFP